MTEPVVYLSGMNAVPPAPITNADLFGFKFANHNLVIGSNRIGPQYELRNVKSRSLTVRLQDEDTASFFISGDASETKLIDELDDDLWWYRDGVLLHRGRILSSTDNAGPTYDVSYNSSGYEALLDRRVLTIFPRSTQIATFTSNVFTIDHIIKWLVQHAENQQGMYLGLSFENNQWQMLPSFQVLWQAMGLTGTDFVLQDGTAIMDAIRTVCSMVEPDLDFWIDPFLRVNLAYQRGKDQGQILDYEGVIAGFSRSFNSDQFGNVIWQTGASSYRSYYSGGSQLGVPKTATHKSSLSADLNTSFTHADYSVSPIGGWTLDKSDENLPSQPAVDQAAIMNWRKATGWNGTEIKKVYSYNATFAPGAWRGPTHVWVGDTVWFVAQRGRVNVREKMRVVSLTLNVDDNGVETISVELNRTRDDQLALKKFRDAVKKIRKNL